VPVRRPSLEEWFLAYQLDRLKRDHFHLPFYVDVDLAPVLAAAPEGRRPSVTALLVKASGMLAAERPEANRVVFRTFYGMRILEPGYVAVNVPAARSTPRPPWSGSPSSSPWPRSGPS